MPIIKPGFRPGFRGRFQAPACNRRMYYLASQKDRDAARLLGLRGQELTPESAIEVLGGPNAAYHEVIVSPSREECAAILARCPGNPDSAMKEACERIAKAYAKGRPYVLAIHEQDGRFHFHLAVAGAGSEHAFGRHGKIQKTWNSEFQGDNARIQDWAAHRRFKAEQLRLRQILRDQRENERQRIEAVKRAAPDRKADVARPYERRARDLVEHRHLTETTAIHARYEARGTMGSPHHKAELEQANHRRTGALRRLEKRECAREVGVAKERLGNAVATGGRVTRKGAHTAGRITCTAVELAMKELGVPRPVRQVTRAGLVLAQEAAQAVLKSAQEAAKAAARSSLHVAQASLKLGAGLVAAIPSGGASLELAGKEAGQDLAQAGKELGKGAMRTGSSLAQGAARTAKAGAQELIPHDVRSAASLVATTGRTAVGAAKDILSLSPLALGKTLAGGAVEISRTTTHATGMASNLPEPVRRAFQVAGWIPVVGLFAKAAQLSAETAQTAVNATSRGMEVTR